MFSKYGHAGIWCWIKKDYPLLRFGVWYLPLFIICILLVATYVYIYYRKKALVRSSSTVGHANKTAENKGYRDEVKPLIAFPLIYVVLTIPIFVYRVYDSLHPDEAPSYGLLVAAVLSAPSVGFCNASGLFEQFCFLKQTRPETMQCSPE